MINKVLLRLASMSMQRVLFLAVIVAGLFYATLYDDGAALDQQIAQLQGQISTEESKSRESDIALKELELVQSSLKALDGQFKATAQQLPSELQTTTILRSIDTLAKASGVSVTTKEPSSTKREDILEMLPLRVVMHGSFSEITMFLYYISSMERITRVLNYSLGPPDANDAGKYKPGTLLFDGQIASYRYVPAAKAEVKEGEPDK